MERLFEIAHFTRSALIGMLKGMTEEQYCKIPEGHKNSVFWNMAHLMVTQQLLLYRLSGLPLHIGEDLVERYGKGSFAKPEVSKEDVDYVLNNLERLSVQAEEDYKRGLFKSYKPYMTSTGIELSSIEDGINFSTFHDGIHLGVVLSLKKIV